MKVLMTARWPVGGIRTFFRYVFSQPAFQDCEITLVAPGDDLAKDLGRYLDPGRFTVMQTAESSRELGTAVREQLGSGDFDLLNSHGLTASLVSQFASIGRHVPHLMTVHDVFLPSMFAGIKGHAKRHLIGAMLRNVDAIHAVSDDCAQNFQDFIPAVPSRRMCAISHGIDTDRFASAEPIDIRHELGLTCDTGLVGFFGRFMAQKGFRTLVDAVEVLKHEGFVRPIKIVTFGWGGFIREDFQYIADRGLSDCFIQQPHTDEPERWMKGMDVVAMPSRWEACGLVAMEALAAGVPIVGTTCIGLREVLRDTPATMVPPPTAVH